MRDFSRRSRICSILRRKFRAGSPDGFIHWDGDGHLMTVAPTRTGKARTTIIPNLLRYALGLGPTDDPAPA